MENNNVQENKPKENNKRLIIASAVILVVVVGIFVGLGFAFGWFGSSNGNSDSNNKASKSSAETIKVVDTKGSESKTVKADISIRDVNFKDSIKKVEKFEKKQKDTVNNPSKASTKDGYTYLTYQYTPKAKFFGVKPGEAQTGALLQYVFKKGKLFDIRIQFGNISKKNRTKVEKTLIKKYGKPTYTIKYSNDSDKKQWRTVSKDYKKQTILAINYSPNSGTVVNYESLVR